jgi:hypothetical protein
VAAYVDVVLKPHVYEEGSEAVARFQYTASQTLVPEFSLFTTVQPVGTVLMVGLAPVPESCIRRTSFTAVPVGALTVMEFTPAVGPAVVNVWKLTEACAGPAKMTVAKSVARISAAPRMAALALRRPGRVRSR